jgi:hypothetical protein
MTKKQAIALYDSKFYEAMTDREIAEFQMMEDRLCMPFDVFCKALQNILGRPVYTHEFGLNRQGLMDELFKGASPPTLEDLINMIPADKRILIQT